MSTRLVGPARSSSLRLTFILRVFTPCPEVKVGLLSRGKARSSVKQHVSLDALHPITKTWMLHGPGVHARGVR